MTRPRLLILFGGASSEHEISLRSARSVLDAVDRTRFEPFAVGIGRDRQFSTGPVDAPLDTIVTDGTVVPDLRALAPDLVFPVLHGPGGEDGSIAGWLESLGLPYVGSGILASAMCMDKATQKHLLARVCPEIPLVSWSVVHADTVASPRDRKAKAVELAETLGFPCFVKPANLGSSVGMTRARTLDELDQGLLAAVPYDRKLVVERGIEGARELEIGVLGNEDHDLRVSAPGEILLPAGCWYDYETKYERDVAVTQIPAVLPEETARAIDAFARRAFCVTECRGLARIDFLVDPKTHTAYLNELNTMPGFTSISMYPKLFAHAGLDMTALLSRLCELGLQAHADRAKRRTTR